MRNAPILKVEKMRTHGPGNSRCGCASIEIGSSIFTVVFSEGAGWDHVSVSHPGRLPTWTEMCAVKELFFRDDEAVMQLHPPKTSYVNNHVYCLHLWRPQDETEIDAIRKEWERTGEFYPDAKPPGTIPLPPDCLVGIKELGTIYSGRAV